MNPTRARVLVTAGFVTAMAAAFFAGRERAVDPAASGAAPAVVLAVRDLARLDATFAPGAIVGDRYPSFVMKYAAH